MINGNNTFDKHNNWALSNKSQRLESFVTTLDDMCVDDPASLQCDWRCMTLVRMYRAPPGREVWLQ